jgi:hypothetical protein
MIAEKKTPAGGRDRRAYRRAGEVHARSLKALEHFQAKWMPIRVKKMRENKNLVSRFDFIKSGH